MPITATLGPCISPLVSTRIPASLRKSETTSLGHFTCTRSTPHSRSTRATTSPTASESPPRCPAPRSKRHSSEKVSDPPRLDTHERPPPPRALPLRGEARSRGRALRGKLQQPRRGRLDLVDDLEPQPRVERAQAL